MRTCDSCQEIIIKGEGKFWITGHFLCPKCYKEWRYRHNIINDIRNVNKVNDIIELNKKGKSLKQMRFK